MALRCIWILPKTLLFCLSLLVPFTGSYGGEILVATIAQVKNHVITTREIQMNYILDRILKYEPYLESKKGPVDTLIYEWLLVFEAMDFYDSRMSPDVINGKMKSLLPALKKVKGWEDLGVETAELRQLVTQKMEARRLFEFKRKASRLPVSDSEVEIEYKQNRVRYGTQTLNAVRESIRSRKIAENLVSRLKNWFTVLETKYRVQHFAEYGKE